MVALGKIKRVRTTAEAVGLGVFYVGILAVVLYAILNLLAAGAR